MTDLSKIKVADKFRHLDANHGLTDDISSGFTSIRYRGKALALQHGGELYPFRRDDDGTPLSYLDFIVLGISAGTSKVYFGNQGEWNEDSASGPICASVKGDVPDPGVPIKQAQSCGICPNNEWVTKPDGRRGQACQSYKRLAVLLMPNMTKKMLNGALLEPVYLKIPPGSFRSMKTYFDALSNEGIPYAAVITRLSFASDKLFQMNFELIKALSDKEADVVLPLMDSGATRQILGSKPQVRTIAPPPRQEPPDDTGLLQAFGRAPDDDEEEPAPPPPAAKPRGRPAVKPKPVEQVSAKPAEDTPWEESDTDLDDTVAKLMGDKMGNMLK